jgi:hypothetical protein
MGTSSSFQSTGAVLSKGGTGCSVQLWRGHRRAVPALPHVELFERTQAAGAIRPDAVVNDVALILEQLASIRLGDEAERTHALRRRYLALALDGLRVRPEHPLPGAPPTDDELTRRWQPG